MQKPFFVMARVCAIKFTNRRKIPYSIWFDYPFLDVVVYTTTVLRSQFFLWLLVVGGSSPVTGSDARVELMT